MLKVNNKEIALVTFQTNILASKPSTSLKNVIDQHIKLFYVMMLTKHVFTQCFLIKTNDRNLFTYLLVELKNIQTKMRNENETETNKNSFTTFNFFLFYFFFPHRQNTSSVA